MVEDRIATQYAPPRMKLFRFWNAENLHFKSNLEGLVCRSELFLSSRTAFNDPFDVRPIVKCDWSPNRVREHAKNISTNPMRATSPQQAMAHLLSRGGSVQARLSLAEIRKIKQKFLVHMEELFDSMGICCFTQEMQNPIFWAHYAGSYTGVCAELHATDDTSHPFCNVMRVHYTKERPTIYASQSGALDTVYRKHQDWSYIAQYGVCTKSEDWSVEREWRWWLPMAAHSSQALPPHALNRIFLGPRATTQTRNFVTELVRGANTKVPVFETSLSTSDFRVERGKRLI